MPAKKQTKKTKVDIHKAKPWLYQGKVIDTLPPGCIGFVYIINCQKNGMKYIGQKLCISQSGKSKGKETNWQNYWGSSQLLQGDYQKFGYEHFQKHITQWGRTKAEVSYWEMVTIALNHALVDDSFYNRSIKTVLYANTLEQVSEEYAMLKQRQKELDELRSHSESVELRSHSESVEQQELSDELQQKINDGASGIMAEPLDLETGKRPSDEFDLPASPDEAFEIAKEVVRK